MVPGIPTIMPVHVCLFILANPLSKFCYSVLDEVCPLLLVAALQSHCSLN